MDSKNIDKAKILVAHLVLSLGEDSISVLAREKLVNAIALEIGIARHTGKLDVIDALFPSYIEYYGDSPLREAALKIVFGEQTNEN